MAKRAMNKPADRNEQNGTMAGAPTRAMAIIITATINNTAAAAKALA